MDQLRIAYTREARDYFSTNRELVLAENTDFTDVAAVGVTDLDTAHETQFGIPIFVVLKHKTNWTIAFLIKFTESSMAIPLMPICIAE